MVRAPGERKAAFIMGGIILAEGYWIFINMNDHPAALLRYAGFPSTGTGVLGWVLAAAVALVYI